MNAACKTILTSVVCGMLLSGCLGAGGAGVASRAETDAAGVPALGQKEASKSAIIADLLRRRSVIVQGSPYAKVSDAVLAANARAAESELRAARLRAVAAEKNWLPTIGPNISLSSMGDLVTSIIVEQVIWQGGRKKAERAFAAADVEYAAVVLSEDTNTRVMTALALYLKSEQGREEAEISARGLEILKRFEWVMQQRVDGGVSDMSELNVMTQKRGELEEKLRSGVEAAATALVELNAMSVRSLEDVRGTSGAKVPSASATRSLEVLRAEADKTRIVAQAKIDRSGFLPNVKAQQRVGSGEGASIGVSTDQGLGFGTGAKLKAIKAAEEAASRKVAQAQEDSDRALASLRSNLSALERQAANQAVLAQQAKQNYDLFQQQYEAGTSQVLEVVGVFETYLDTERKRVQLKYRAELARLQIAEALGLLVNGNNI